MQQIPENNILKDEKFVMTLNILILVKNKLKIL